MDKGLRIQLKPRDKEKSKDIELTYNEIWYWIFKNCKQYVTSKGGKFIINNYLDECRNEGWFDEETHTLFYAFPNPGGMTPVSMEVSLHWFRVSLLQLWQGLNRVISTYGYEIEKVDDETTLNKEDIKFIEINGEIKQIETDDYDNIQIISDIETIAFNELTPAQKKMTKTAYEEALCQCPLCKKIRDGKKPIDVAEAREKEPMGTGFMSLSMALRYPHRAKSLLLEDVLEISDDISKLYSLEKLSVYGSCLDDITDEIGNLPKLRELTLSVSRINKELPQSMCALKSLEELELNIAWGLHRIPENIGDLKNLRSLKISSNEITMLPESLKGLTGLRHINFTNCEKLNAVIEAFEFDAFTELETLNIRYTGQKRFPMSALKCKKLKKLNISLSEIDTIPDNIKNLQCLEELDFGDTLIMEIPSEVYGLKYLKRLTISYTGIMFIDKSIGNLVNLECLILGDTKIKSIPETIGNCKKLKSIYIDNTEIDTLPESIRNCTELEKIFCNGHKKESIRKILDDYGMDKVQV